MEKYSYRVRKDEYAWSKWYAEMLEDGVVVKRYDFPSEQEAQTAISKWKHYQKGTHKSGD